MSALEQMDELTQLQNECQALENKAGISQPMERAREGRFIPLGALGDDASPDEYFADEHDHFRENARDAYFSVEDLSLRKKLIAAQRKVERNIRQSIEARVAKASRAVSAANAKTQNLPWVKAAAMAVGAVAIGYWVFGLIGAIAGAVGGFFLGQGVVSDARSNASTELQQATLELEQAQKDRKERLLWPECFSRHEELTGKREEHLD